MDEGEVKIGVYNLYWPTFGGGEQQSGSIVDALSAEHEVHLVGPDGFDIEAARERLGLRLEGVGYHRIATDDLAATVASADYDVFINHTYRSVAPNLAPLGIYFVMFPHDLDGERRVASMARRVAGGFAAPVRLLGGITSKAGSDHVFGPAQVQIADGVGQVELELDAPRADEFAVVAVAPIGEVQRVAVAGATRLVLPPGARHVLLVPTRESDDSHPEDLPRVSRVWADGVEVQASPHSYRQRLATVRTRDFIPTYDRFVSLSEYTRRWTERRWGRGGDVVAPPVAMRTAGEKECLILSVGRFFAPTSGHCKRQLELVQAFRMLLDAGLSGWRLVLIGGCAPDDRDYAMSVRAAAEGLPVEVRLNAPGAVLDAHLAGASIYWHAAGFGADLEANPEQAEHFGISPIEAMSAGAVPVVFDAGGPAEVVHHDRDGLVYRTLDELVQHTRRLVDDDALRSRLATAAAESARWYARPRFEAEVRELVTRVAAERPPQPR